MERFNEKTKNKKDR